MKKFLCIVLSLLAVTGCATSSKTSVGDDTTEITSSEGISGTDLSDLSVTYSKEDFGLYTPPDKDRNSSFIIGLDEDQDALPFNDNELVRYLAVTNYDVKDKVVKFEGDEVPTDHTVVSHISYEGGNLPVVNSKGISVIGLKGEDNKKCSTPDDVKVAYDINRKQEEEYITSKIDDKNYVIQLYFKKTEVPQEQTEVTTNEEGKEVQQLVYKYERIIVEKGKDLLNVPEATYSMKFIVRDGYVKSIDLYSYR